jgi:hypothetical protein
MCKGEKGYLLVYPLEIYILSLFVSDVGSIWHCHLIDHDYFYVSLPTQTLSLSQKLLGHRIMLVSRILLKAS